MALPRFYAPEARDELRDVVLPEDEAGHLTRVMRLGVGATVRVFDGSGHEWDATVRTADRAHVVVSLNMPVVPLAEPRIHVTLAIGLIKGDKMDDVVRDATMLGVVAVVPLATVHTEPSVVRAVTPARRARWRRIAIHSAKQSGRAIVPDIAPAAQLSELLERPTPVILLVEPTRELPCVPFHQVPKWPEVVVAVGPEGGWAVDELRLAIAHGATPVRLGSLTLRADAAPLVAIAALRAHWGDY